jgi:transcriptional regulator with XRE-family HTH domain
VHESLDTPTLTRRLREVRKQRRMTLAELADYTSLSIAHLSRIEKGLRRPSLNALLRIAETYGMSLGQLVGVAAPGSHEVIRAEPDTADDREPDEPDMALLSGALPALTCVRHTIGEGWVSETVTHSGEEWIYALSGGLRVRVSGEEELLAPGDAIHFEAWNPHQVEAVDRRASFLLVTTGAPSRHVSGGRVVEL